MASVVAADLEQDNQLRLCESIKSLFIRLLILLFAGPLFIDMKAFAEESVTGVRSLLQSLLCIALWHRPTLIVLDNLHQFVGVETEVRQHNKQGREHLLRSLQHTDSFKSTQVAEIFLNFFNELSRHPIAVLATAESVTALHKRVSSGHAFSKIVTIRAPNRDARSQVSPSSKSLNTTHKRHLDP